MGSTMKNRPQTARNNYSEGMQDNIAQNESHAAPEINDRFQSLIGPFAQGKLYQ